MAAGGALAETYTARMPFIIAATVMAVMAGLALLLKVKRVAREN
jgi:hypothetical protein